MKNIKKSVSTKPLLKLIFLTSYTYYSYSNIKTEDLYSDSLINILKRESRI